MRNMNVKSVKQCCSLVAIIVLATAAQEKEPAQKLSPIYGRADTTRCSGYQKWLLENQYLATLDERHLRLIEKEQEWLEQNCRGGGGDLPPRKKPKKQAIDEPPPAPHTIVDSDSEWVCFKQDIWLERTPERWYFKTCKRKIADKKCICAEQEKIIYEVTPPLSEFGSRDRGYDFIPVHFNEETKFDTSAHQVPYNFANDEYAKWRNEEFKCSDIYHHFRMIIPSRNSETVWVLMPNKQFIVAENLRASWFEKPDSAKFPKVNDLMVKYDGLLQRLAVCAANDPQVQVLRCPNFKSLSFYVAGNLNNKAYLFAFGYDHAGNWSGYVPVQLISGIEASRQYVQSILPNPPEAIEKLLSAWRATGEEKIIQAVLPRDCFRGNIAAYSPLNFLGKPSQSQPEPPCLQSALMNHDPIDLLISRMDGGSYEVWTSSGKRTKTWYDKVSDHQNLWLAWMAIADTSIAIIATDINTKTLSFISRQHPNALWSWIGGGQAGPPVEHQLLKGEDQFLLRGERQAAYIRGLIDDISWPEKKFFLQRADSPNSFRLLDFFTYDDDPTRVLLYVDTPETKKTNTQPLQIYRVGIDTSKAPNPLVFQIVEDNWGNQWESLRTLYAEVDRNNDQWRRKIIYENYARDLLWQAEIWFGPDRLGVAYEPSAPNSTSNPFMRVFLKAPKSSFGPVKFSSIEELVRQDGVIVYMNPRYDLKTDLFYGWLAHRWDSLGIWRALPLGYFDRITLRRKDK